MNVKYYLYEGQKEMLDKLLGQKGNTEDYGVCATVYDITEDQKEILDNFLNKEGIIVDNESEKWPKVGDKYYYNSSYYINGVLSSTYDGTIIDQQLMTVGNFFKTSEEAEFMREKIKVIAEMRKFAEPKDRAWDGENKHWYFYTSVMYKPPINVIIGYVSSMKDCNIYFESMEKAEECLKSVGEDRINKYYFEIMEES